MANIRIRKFLPFLTLLALPLFALAGGPTPPVSRPGGVNGNFQFNDRGVFGGIPSVNYSTTTKVVSMSTVTITCLSTNGVTCVDFGSLGQNQTPWLSDIDAAGFSLFDATNIDSTHHGTLNLLQNDGDEIHLWKHTTITGSLDIVGGGAHGGYLALDEQSVDLPTPPDTGVIYTKDVSGVTQLFYREDLSGNVYQLTPTGGGGGSPGLPDRAIQFGLSGIFTGDVGLVFNSTGSIHLQGPNNSVDIGYGNEDHGSQTINYGRNNSMDATGFRNISVGVENITEGNGTNMNFGYNNQDNGDSCGNFGNSNVNSANNSFNFGINDTNTADNSFNFGGNLTNNIPSTVMIGPADTGKITISTDGVVSITGTNGRVLAGAGTLTSANDSDVSYGINLVDNSTLCGGGNVNVGIGNTINPFGTGCNSNLSIFGTGNQVGESEQNTIIVAQNSNIHAARSSFLGRNLGSNGDDITEIGDNISDQGSHRAVLIGRNFTSTFDLHNDQMVFALQNSGKVIIDIQGKLAVGGSTNTPTAYIETKQGVDGSTGTAAIKISSGTLLSIEEKGAVESNGVHIYWTDGFNNRLQLDQQGGGGGSSALAVDVNSVQISSPTDVINFSNNFRGVESPGGQANIDLATFIHVSSITVGDGTIFTSTTQFLGSGEGLKGTIADQEVAFGTGTVVKGSPDLTWNQNDSEFRVNGDIYSNTIADLSAVNVIEFNDGGGNFNANAVGGMTFQSNNGVFFDSNFTEVLSDIGSTNTGEFESLLLRIKTSSDTVTDDTGSLIRFDVLTATGSDYLGQLGFVTKADNGKFVLDIVKANAPIRMMTIDPDTLLTTISSDTKVTGKLQVLGGNPQAGYVLSSLDTNGNAVWSPSGSIGGIIALNQIAFGNVANNIQGSSNFTVSGSTMIVTGDVKISNTGIPTIHLNQNNAGADAGLISFDTLNGQRAYWKAATGSWAIGVSTASSTPTDRLVFVNQTGNLAKIQFNPNNKGLDLIESQINFNNGSQMDWAVSNSLRIPTGQFIIQGSSFGVNNVLYKWPAADGTNGQVLTTNGNKFLSWTTVSGGGGNAVLTATQTWSGQNSYRMSGAPGIVFTQIAPTGTGDLTGGAMVIDNTLNQGGSGLKIYSNAQTQPNINGLLHLIANSTSYNEPMIYIQSNATSTIGANADMRIDSNNPDIEFQETDQLSPGTGLGKWEIAVNFDNLQFNFRNASDTSFQQMIAIDRNSGMKFEALDGSFDYVSWRSSQTIGGSFQYVWPSNNPTDNDSLHVHAFANGHYDTYWAADIHNQSALQTAQFDVNNGRLQTQLNSNTTSFIINQHDLNSQALRIINDGGSNSIYVENDSDTGNGSGSSGSIFVNNTFNPGIGLQVYSNRASVSPSNGLAFFKYANTVANGPVVRIDNSGTGNGLKIVEGNNAGSSIGSSGAIFVDNSANVGIGVQVYSSTDSASSPLLYLMANNTNYATPIAVFESTGVSSNAVNLRLKDQNPDLEFQEIDQATPAGKWKIDVQSDRMRILARTSADNGYETEAQWGSIRSATGMFMELESTGTLRFADADSSNYVAFKASATVASNVTWTLPPADGAANTILATDGSSHLSFVSPSSLAGVIGGSITNHQVAIGSSTANSIWGSGNFTADGSTVNVTGFMGINVANPSILAALAVNQTDNGLSAVKITHAGSYRAIWAISQNGDAIYGEAVGGGGTASIRGYNATGDGIAVWANQAGGGYGFKQTGASGHNEYEGKSVFLSTANFQGDITISTTATTLYISTGTNGMTGIATLTLGQVVVSNKKVTANTRVFVSPAGGTVTNIGIPYWDSTANVAGTSFTINSSNVLDAEKVLWFMYEPTP